MGLNNPLLALLDLVRETVFRYTSGKNIVANLVVAIFKKSHNHLKSLTKKDYWA